MKRSVKAIALAAAALTALAGSAAAQDYKDWGVIDPASAQLFEESTLGPNYYVMNGIHYTVLSEDAWEDSFWNEEISSDFVTDLGYEKVCIHYSHSSTKYGYTDFPENYTLPWDEWVVAEETDLGRYFASDCMLVAQYLVGTWRLIDDDGETISTLKPNGNFDAVFRPNAGGDQERFTGKFRVTYEQSGYFHLAMRLEPKAGEEAVIVRNLMQIDDDGRLQNLTAGAEAVRLP